MPEPDTTPAACVWPGCLADAQKVQLANQVTASMHGESIPPMPDQRPICGCTEAVAPAICGFPHDEWDGPYVMPRRCIAPAGHSDGRFAYDHGPWEWLPKGSDRGTGRTAQGTSGRTETGATIANPQAAGAEAGDIERGHLRDQLCEAFIRLIRDHADRSVIAPGYMADAALHVRDQEMQALRDELAENAGVIRALRRQRDTAEETVARVREAAADTIMFGPNASLAVPLSRLRTALTPPADQDRGGQ